MTNFLFKVCHIMHFVLTNTDAKFSLSLLHRVRKVRKGLLNTNFQPLFMSFKPLRGYFLYMVCNTIGLITNILPFCNIVTTGDVQFFW